MKRKLIILALITFYIARFNVLASQSNFKQEIYPITECNDGIDNDGDGFIDFMSDPNCDSWLDNNESPDPPPSYPENPPQEETKSPVTSISRVPLILTQEEISDLNDLEIEISNFLSRFFWKPLGEVIGMNQKDINQSAIITARFGLPLFVVIFIVLILLPLIISFYIKRSERNKK